MNSNTKIKNEIPQPRSLGEHVMFISLKVHENFLIFINFFIMSTMNRLQLFQFLLSSGIFWLFLRWACVKLTLVILWLMPGLLNDTECRVAHGEQLSFHISYICWNEVVDFWSCTLLHSYASACMHCRPLICVILVGQPELSALSHLFLKGILNTDR